MTDDKLKADQAYYEQRVEEARNDLFTPRETDRAAAEEALTLLLKSMHVECESIEWAEHPGDRNDAAAWAYPWGSAGWAVYADVALEVGRLEVEPDAEDAIKAWKVLAAEVAIIGSEIENGNKHVMVPRATVSKLDENYEFHSEDGPALAWGDDFKVYYWHGIEVPEWVVKDPSIENINREENIEFRRCAIEHLGWETFISMAALDLLSSDEYGDLYQVDAKWWGEPRTMALVRNGTPERDGTVKKYGLLGPAEMKSALEVVAWSYDIAPEEYAQLERRT